MFGARPLLIDGRLVHPAICHDPEDGRLLCTCGLDDGPDIAEHDEYQASACWQDELADKNLDGGE